ncbi:thioredoxin domain-containing protein [Spirochaeta isovalerica]|uniref:Thiol-disulfide isomerase/thioredoxin n=1 Tax=Spirochaeta isovalerica TaxID=150 RepID=A0A841RCW3_9SPIO|nr:thioredoxin family protein [Spirochaeta isovalerica]MBB6481845.1 thiol-disulfide isomerase/thioredoxin [Spirochaeta isovalerica]
MKLFTIITAFFFALSFGLFASGEKDMAGQDSHDSMEMDSMEKDDTMEMSAMSGGLMDFVSMDKAMMMAEETPTVLFFNASWCPTCRAAVKDFEMNAMKLEGINLLSVDYDDSADLKQKYEITYQHTFVQIDSMGKVLAMWNGGETEELLKQIKMDKM